jgi:hypothetical protein
VRPGHFAAWVGVGGHVGGQNVPLWHIVLLKFKLTRGILKLLLTVY